MEKAYLDHSVFGQLSKYAEFYENLAYSIGSFISMGVRSFPNIDTYVYSSMQGTIESIRDVLIEGRINDAYALLRKYYDAAIINVYTNLFLEENFSVDNFIVDKINNWVVGEEQLPDVRSMKNYIQKSGKVTNIHALLHKDKTYTKLRERCNDHTHYNFYRNILLNDNKVYINNRVSVLAEFSRDLENIFILHLSYLFYIKDHYMMSSDYLDYLDCGLEPEPGSQYLVAPFIQEIFDSVIKKSRMDLVMEIKSKTAMRLE